MELIVQVQTREALDAALEAGVAGVTVNLPRDPDGAWWAEVKAWQAAARGRQVKFYLQWDRLVREEELPRSQEALAAIAALSPDALVLRDLGLCRQARLRHPGLKLHAAGSLGLHNSPGLRLAETMGFSRVVLEGPINLKDLALMRRQTDLPLEVVLPHPCPGFGHLCLMDEYLGGGCPSLLPARPAGRRRRRPASWPPWRCSPASPRWGWRPCAGRGLLPGPAPEPDHRTVPAWWRKSTPAGRPRVLAAAREVLAAFGEEFRLEFPPERPLTRPKRPAPPHRIAAPRPPRSGPGPPPPPAASGWRPGTMPRPSPWPRGGKSL